MKIEELTWADIQAILVIDEKIMLEKYATTGRLRAFSQRHCTYILREFKKRKETTK